MPDPAVASTPSQSSPFIKQLASSDKRIRDRALAALRTYLHHATHNRRAKPLSDLDYLKLWKGLFFCMWMSDKALNQQRLARDLAALVDELSGKENFLGFVKAFWKTIAREWSGIESLRLDKFLYLVRCYVNKGFDYVRQQRWEDELLQEYLAILESVPLNAKDTKIPNGLKFHVIEIYLDELDKVAGDDAETPLDTILAPMRKLGKETVTKAIRERVKDVLEDKRLLDWTGPREDEDDDDSDDAGGDAHGDDDQMGSDGSDFGGFD